MADLTINSMQELQERVSEIGSVACFEGLSIEDFKRVLPDQEPKNEAIRSLTYHALNRLVQGNPKRIDSGEEAYVAAEIFIGPFSTLLPFSVTQNDLDHYIYHFYEANRQSVANEYQLSQVDHPLTQLFDHVSPNYLYYFRSLPSFDALTTQLTEKIPEIKTSREIQVLYPGSGSHIAPLITAMQLIDQGIIDHATFTYTEIVDYSDHLELLLKQGEELGIFESVTVREPKKMRRGSEQTFEVTYQGKKIEIIFALNRSGKQYYRKKYIKDADLVILHDPGIGDLSNSYDLLASILIQKVRSYPEKEQMLIMEGTNRRSRHWSFGFPNEIERTELPGPYGHCNGFKNSNAVEEIRHCNYETASTFLLNDPHLLEMSKQAREDWILSEILFPSRQEAGPLIGVSAP